MIAFLRFVLSMVGLPTLVFLALRRVMRYELRLYGVQIQLAKDLYEYRLAIHNTERSDLIDRFTASVKVAAPDGMFDDAPMIVTGSRGHSTAPTMSEGQRGFTFSGDTLRGNDAWFVRCRTRGGADRIVFSVGSEEEHTSLFVADQTIEVGRGSPPQPRESYRPHRVVPIVGTGLVVLLYCSIILLCDRKWMPLGSYWGGVVGAWGPAWDVCTAILLASIAICFYFLSRRRLPDLWQGFMEWDRDQDPPTTVEVPRTDGSKPTEPQRAGR